MKKVYKCIVVDDEPIARKIIKNYIAELPNLEFVKECKNAYEAIEFLEIDTNIDIIFLDINMPNLSGISMAKILSNKYQIIFTTAYSEFAIESYEISAVDYLLKPFLFERFYKAVLKAIEKIKLNNFNNDMFINESISKVFLKSSKETFPIVLDQILYCEAMKNYTKVVLKDSRTITTLTTFSNFEKDLLLLSNNFVRIHRSFIISKKDYVSIALNYVLVGTVKIPLGIKYKSAFLQNIGYK